MRTEQRTSVRDQYRQITSSPEHQRRRLFAQTRARMILRVGLPLALVAFIGLGALGIPPLYVALSCVLIGVASGWAIGTHAAAKKERNPPLS